MMIFPLIYINELSISICLSISTKNHQPPTKQLITQERKKKKNFGTMTDNLYKYIPVYYILKKKILINGVYM